MSHESFDPSKYKNIAEIPETEQDKFEVVPTATGAPEEFVMASAVEYQKLKRAEAEEINKLIDDIKYISDEEKAGRNPDKLIIKEAEDINRSLNRLSYSWDKKAPTRESTTLEQEEVPYRQSDRYKFEISKERADTERKAGWDAEKENEARGLWSKIFRKNEVDSMDIVRRQAEDTDSYLSERKKRIEGSSIKELYDMRNSANGADHRGYDTGDTIEKVEKELEKKEGARKEEKTGELASLLHDEWRASRKKEDGTFNPQVKVLVATDDGKEKWFNADKVPPTAKELKRQDIANTDYENLDPYYQGENKISAEVAIGEVYKNRNAIDDYNREAFIEGASNVMHEKWLERNGSWAPPEQKLPYAELSEEEKEKDRVIIRRAIEIYQSGE